jgi:hypothetical protein
MKKIVKLTENDLTRLVKRVIKEETSEKLNFADFNNMLNDVELADQNNTYMIFQNPDKSVMFHYGLKDKVITINNFKGVDFGPWNPLYLNMLASAIMKKFKLNISDFRNHTKEYFDDYFSNIIVDLLYDKFIKNKKDKKATVYELEKDIEKAMEILKNKFK